MGALLAVSPPESNSNDPYAPDAGDNPVPQPVGTDPYVSDAGEAWAPPPLLTAIQPVTGDTERVVPQQDFVKGELSVYLGSDRLVVKKNRIGVSLGLTQIDRVYYAAVEPQFDAKFLDRKLAFGIGVPLNFEVVDFRLGPDGKAPLTQNAGRLRSEDWARPNDYARILTYLTYGHKEDNLFVNVGQVYASSIGHGAIVRRYAADIDVNLPRVSAQVDAYNDYAGFEALTNDVVQWNLIGALGFVKPLSWIDTLFTKSLSIGVTAAADLQAPLSLKADPVTQGRFLDSQGRLAANTGQVVLGGIDAEVKVVKTASVDIKPYVDYSRLFGGDAGWTFGALGRFNARSGDTVHAFRVIAELRFLGSRYRPGYFDTFYEVTRYQSSIAPSVNPGIINYQTQYQDVMSGATPAREGYYFEASYGIRGGVGVTFALEGDSASAARNFVAHVEVPALSFLQVFASYYKRGFTDFSQLTTPDEQSIFFAGARLRTLPFLFFNARAYKTFSINPDTVRYDNTFGFMVNGELGWEFWTQAQAAQDSAG